MQKKVTMAIKKGPHKSAMKPDAMAQFAAEAEAKQIKWQRKIVLWDNIRHRPPKQLKVSPLAAVLHKSRKWRAILVLSFCIQLKAGEIMLVNEASKK